MSPILEIKSLMTFWHIFRGSCKKNENLKSMPICHNLALHNCKYYSVVFRRKYLGNHCCSYSYLETNHRCLLNPNDDTMVLHLLHSDKPKVYYTLQKSWWKCKIASLVYLAPTYIYIRTYYYMRNMSVWYVEKDASSWLERPLLKL